MTTAALLLAIALGVPLGVLSAVYRNSWIDNFSRSITLLGVSVPSFWLGLLLIYVLFYLLRIFPPPSGRIGLLISPPERITGLYLVDSVLTGNWRAFSSSAQHLALPVITQALVTLAPITRLMRSSMLEVLGSEYIQAARANGVPERQIYFRDALRNALLAPLTFVALVYGNLLGGSVVIERIFSWPGVGRYALESIVVKDYNAVQGFVLLAAVLYVLVFLVVDILYFVIDPRITA
jgi:peptide/nickel transport system permease protein